MQFLPIDEEGNTVNIFEDQVMLAQLFESYLDYLDQVRTIRKKSNYLSITFDKHWYE